MSQVLIINDDRIFGSSLKNLVEKSYKIDALTFLDPSEAYSMLQIFPDVDVIVCLEKSAQRVCEYLIKNYEKEVNVLIIGNNKTIYPTAVSIPVNANPVLIKQHIGFIMGKEESAPEYPVIKPPAPPSAPVAEIQKVEMKEEVEKSDEDKTTVFKMPF